MLRRALSSTLLGLLLVLGTSPLGVGATEAGGGESPAAEVPAEGGEEPLPGPEPQFGSENTFQPRDYEAPWTWWMGVVLTAVAVLTIGGVALGWWLLVPKDRETAGR